MGRLFVKYPDLHKFLSPPYIFLILGVISFFVGAVSTCTGVSWASYGRVVYRAKERKEFWRDVAMCYLAGALFIGIFLLY